jgi:hypothetical protein
MSHIYVIHENSEWTAPLRAEFERLELPYREWFLDEGTVDLSSTPPHGIFYNRMSASSHTRGHRYAPEYTAAVLAWLERHGRIVINNSRAMQLEISKAAQYAALNAHGIPTPKTVVAIGREKILEAARTFEGRPFITKPNRGGKGLGVSLFSSLDALADYVEGEDDGFETPLDGMTLVQEYIESPDASITRCEFVGGEFLYAVRVDTSEGFELCPADDCRPGDLFCPATPEQEASRPRFEIQKEFAHPILERFRGFLADNGMKIAAIEIIENASGDVFAYDVNVNTNYNADAETRAGVWGMGAVARYLGVELARQTESALEAACALS